MNPYLIHLFRAISLAVMLMLVSGCGSGGSDSGTLLERPTTPAAATASAAEVITFRFDDNVHPANTIRLVRALEEADKRFDLVLIPGQAHGFGPMNEYFQRRRDEFFAEHLLGDGVYRRQVDIRE